VAPVSDHHASRWSAAIVLFAASFLNLSAATIVNVALPALAEAFAAPPEATGWVAAAYFLAFAAGLLPLGRFGDVFGRRRLLITGMAAFTVLSLVCGLAPSLETLIAARVAQGLAAAMMVPQVLAIMHVIFPESEKGRALGVFAAVSSLGSVAGPLLGGLLIAVDPGGWGWRMIFLVNAPLGLAALAGMRRWVPPVPAVPGLRPDWGGSLLFVVPILLLTVPAMQGRAWGWSPAALTALAASVPAAFAFVLHQRHRARRGRAQVLPTSLLSNRPFLTGLALTTVFLSAMPGVVFVLAFYFQTGFGFSPLECGLATAPFPLGVAIISTLAARYGEGDLERRMLIGPAVLFAGTLMLLAAIRGAGDAPGVLVFVFPLFVGGLGMGCGVAAFLQTVLRAVRPEDAGAGSGALQALPLAGQVLGIAVTGQIFFATLDSDAAPPTGNLFTQAASAALAVPLAVFAIVTVAVAWQFLRRTQATSDGVPR
jgi:MFS family permease